MRLRNTLVLLGVTVALALFIVVFESGAPSTDERLEAEKLAFPGFKEDRDRADTIEMIRSGAKTVFGKRGVGTKDERWYITHPLDCRADNSRIISLLGAFERTERFRVEEDRRSIPVVPTTDLRQYGLDLDSGVRVRIAAGDEALIDALVGKKTLDGERVYVMPSGRKEVYVVKEDVRENVTRRLDEFRDKRLLDLRAGVVTQVAVFENEKQVYELARERDGPWRMVSPVADRADKVMADGIAGKMGSLWADVFHQDFEVDDPEMPKKLAELELRPARRSVKLTLDVDGEIRQHEVLFGKKIKKTEGATTSWNVYATVVGTGTVVHLPDDVIGKIDVKVDHLRDHRVFAFDASEAVTLAVDRPASSQAPAEQLRIEKSDDEWKLTRPGKHDADARRLEDLLDELTKLRVAKFLPADTKLEKPVRVEVGLALAEEGAEGKGESEVVFFEGRPGGPASGSVRARRGEAGAVFEVPDAVLEKLCAAKYWFWDRTVLTFEHLDIRRIALTRGGRTETAVGRLVKGDDGEEHVEWKLVGEGEVDIVAADNIKHDFSDLEAEELLGPAEDRELAAYGLEAPSIRVEIAVKADVKPDVKPEEREGLKTYALRIGLQAEAAEAGIKRFYAKFEDDPMVFLIRGSVVKKLRKGLAKKKEKGEADEGADGEAGEGADAGAASSGRPRDPTDRAASSGRPRDPPAGPKPLRRGEGPTDRAAE